MSADTAGLGGLAGVSGLVLEESLEPFTRSGAVLRYSGAMAAAVPGAILRHLHPAAQDQEALQPLSGSLQLVLQLAPISYFSWRLCCNKRLRQFEVDSSSRPSLTKYS